jgi:hypothetical protein
LYAPLSKKTVKKVLILKHWKSQANRYSRLERSCAIVQLLAPRETEQRLEVAAVGLSDGAQVLLVRVIKYLLQLHRNGPLVNANALIS